MSDKMSEVRVCVCGHESECHSEFGCSAEIGRDEMCGCESFELELAASVLHSASPVGELEGAFEAWWKKIYDPSNESDWDLEGAYGLAYSAWNAALTSKPAPEGIPERPKATWWVRGNLSCNLHDAYTYCDKVEAIISAKDAEISAGRFMYSSYRTEMAIELAMEYDRAEAAEAELSALKLFSARLRDEGVAKGLRMAEQEVAKLTPANSTAYEATVRQMDFSRRAILSLIPTSPESPQPKENS